MWVYLSVWGRGGGKVLVLQAPLSLKQDQKFRATSLSLARHAISPRSGGGPLPTYPSVLRLIGFNEQFNNTALPDQIKLLLSTTLTTGSLLCNANTSQDLLKPSCPLITHSLTPTNLPSLPMSHSLTVLQSTHA